MPSKKIVLKCYLTPDEYAQVIRSSSGAGLSLSCFAKRLCLGQPVQSLELHQFRRELLRINADLGRLGGLFKLCLSRKDELSRELHREVRRLLWEIEARQRELKDVVGKLSRET